MRTFFTLGTLLFILIAPFWIYLPLILVGIILFPLYIEALALALLVDMLMGQVLFTLVSALLVIFAVPLREHVRFNS
jgi:hypothetical protein